MKKEIKNTLSSLEKTRKKYWNISPQLGSFLNLLIKDRNFKKILEIGTSNGYSGIWMAEALSHTNGMLYTIESHQKERFALGTESFKKARLSQYVKQIAGHAPEAIPEDLNKLDLAFFDATKYEHIKYFKIIEERINKNGMIITDNIHSHQDQLADYIKAIEENPQWISREFHLGTGILLSQKIK